MRRRNEVLVGIVLTVAVLLAVIGTIWLVRGGLSRGYPLYTRFAWGAGLKQGQPVLLAGAQVGYVERVDFEQQGTLLITMRVYKQYHIPEGTTAKIQPVGFFGDQSIALTPVRPTTRFIPAGDTIPVGPPSPTIDQILGRVDSVSRSISDMTRTIQVELVASGGVNDLRQTLASTNKLVSQLSAIAAEQSRQLSATMVQLRHTAAAVDSATVDSTMKNLKATTANVAVLTRDLQGTNARLASLLAKVDSGGGTAGKLVSDPALYDDTRQLLAHLDSVLTDFKKHPKRYINLSIF